MVGWSATKSGALHDWLEREHPRAFEEFLDALEIFDMDVEDFVRDKHYRLLADFEAWYAEETESSIGGTSCA